MRFNSGFKGLKLSQHVLTVRSEVPHNLILYQPSISSMGCFETILV